TSPPLAVYYLFAGLLLTYEWGWTAFQSNMAFYCVVSIVRIYAIRNAKNRSWNPEQNAIVQSALIGPRHG
ncbi:hypothetical protein, partial [Bifidobacterium breve]|uniref:hypothetical protein n=1 Tax=Bifidobacterium breve TaxID=1685 RepID=UPI002164BDBE